MKALSYLLQIVMLAMVLVACGGGDSDDGGEGNTPTDVVDGDTAVSTDTGEITPEDIQVDTGPPAPCLCNVDADCDPGDICVNTEFGWACKAYPPQGLCWNNEHCPFGSVCQDPAPCPCDGECAQEEPGKCTEGTGCCTSDEDCFGGDVCVNSVCKQSLPGKQCWGQEGCPDGESCVGANVCPCESECPSEDTQGKCFPEGQGCCLTDADCGLGEACVDDLCKANPGEGQCWADSQCDLDQTCQGAVSCSCLATSCAGETPGSCQGSLDCCSTDAECDGSQVCVNDACHDPVGGGTCWTDNDCVDAGATCVGAAMCECGVPCAGEQAGTCSGGLENGCCESDSDCDAGSSCVGSVCKEKPSQGSCWSIDDCLVGQVCDGASVCPCNTPCFQEDVLGTCKAETPPGCCADTGDCQAGQICLEGVCNPEPLAKTCYSDGDCGVQEICYGATICPCGTNCVSDMGVCEAADCCADTMPECGEGNICVPPFGCVSAPTEGQCWHDQDCPAGEFCDGEFICSCTADCAEPNTAGTCSPF